MRSTGEVMAGGGDGRPRRTARALRAAGRGRGAAGRSARRCRPRRYPRARWTTSSTRSTRRRPPGEQVVGRDRDRRRSGRRHASPARRWSSPRAAHSSARSRAAASRPTSPSGRSTSSPAGTPSVVHYGVADSEAWEVGLSCGGEIDVWLEQADPELWSDVRALLDADELRDALHDTKTGEKRLERGVLESTGLREDGIFAEVIEGPLRVVIFGAAEAAEHLCAYGKQLGWRTTVVDARPALATPERVPSADEVDQGLARRGAPS